MVSRAASFSRYLFEIPHVPSSSTSARVLKHKTLRNSNLLAQRQTASLRNTVTRRCRQSCATGTRLCRPRSCWGESFKSARPRSACPADVTADHKRARRNSPAGNHARTSARFRTCLLSSALRCHWDILPHALLDLFNGSTPRGLAGDYASASSPRSGRRLIDSRSIPQYTIVRLPCFKTCKELQRTLETCTLGLRRLRLTVNEYCGAERNTSKPVVAD